MGWDSKTSSIGSMTTEPRSPRSLNFLHVELGV